MYAFCKHCQLKALPVLHIKRRTLQKQIASGELFMFNPSKDIGGKHVHVNDCYIWSEIYYLDSTTDYRECLPRPAVRQSPIATGDLVMLDSSRRLFNWRRLPFAFFSLLTLLFLFLGICGVIWCGTHCGL